MLASKSEFTEQVNAITGWRKPSRSGPISDNCVEVAPYGTAVAVRDSRNPGFAALVFDQGEWSTFIDAAKAGEYDDLI